MLFFSKWYENGWIDVAIFFKEKLILNIFYWGSLHLFILPVDMF